MHNMFVGDVEREHSIKMLLYRVYCILYATRIQLWQPKTIRIIIANGNTYLHRYTIVLLYNVYTTIFIIII